MEQTEVNFNTLVHKIAADFSDQAAFSNITLNITESGVCLRDMNADLASVLIINLLKNAIVHNKAGGFVNIIVETDQLIVENSGADIPLDDQKIFKRFHSGQSSQTSSGLGLAIVKAIIELYGLRLSYHHTQNHVMTLHLR